jgi:hypothetical protein
LSTFDQPDRCTDADEASGHDIYRLSKALGHANIGVTETYLKTLSGVS